MVFWKKMRSREIDPARIPCHVAAIMDGNGRWAQKRDLPRTAGHSAGSESFRHAAEYLAKLGVQYFTVYAFSTENWKRPKEEVQAIMDMLEKYLRDAVDNMEGKNVRLRFFGDLTPISPEIKELIEKTNLISEKNTGMTVNICLNYGGRDEIVRGIRMFAEDVASGKRKVEELTEEVFATYLDSAGIPDPELVIRPSGEKRTSNFLPWQTVYSEFVFMNVLWPDFGPADLDAAIEEYYRRNRRFGGA